MVPVGRCPAVRGMAIFATGRESGSGVIRISRSIVGCLMTRIAVGRRAGESRGVTGETGCGQVLSGERKAGGGVIKIRRQPGGGGMAQGTVMVEIAGDVIRIKCLVECTLVTGIASGRCTCKTGTVTRYASCREMSAGQREYGRIMIECRRQPRGGAVTNGAVVIEVVSHVIRVRHLYERRLVTGVAISWCAGVLSSVALDTRGLPVRAGQRESGSIVVVKRRLPRDDRVTESAVV